MFSATLHDDGLLLCDGFQQYCRQKGSVFFNFCDGLSLLFASRGDTTLGEVSAGANDTADKCESPGFCRANGITDVTKGPKVCNYGVIALPPHS